MRKYIFDQLSLLGKNENNNITFFEGTGKSVKKFKEFADDVKCMMKRLSFLGIKEGDKVGIIGYTSYNWLVLDYACKYSGIHVVAIPESYSKDLQNSIQSKLQLKGCFVDYLYREKIGDFGNSVYYFNCPLETANDLLQVDLDEDYDFTINRVLKDYSTVFSSGTSENVKYINRTYPDLKEKDKKKPSIFKKIVLYFRFRGSIWMEIRKKKNKIIIFLPFSHPMQRDFANICLGRGIDIVLSNPKNCIKHIMLEKPNIMISVPPVYDALATLIEARINKFNSEEQILFEKYLEKGINKKSNTNKKKIWYQENLFKKVRKIYGGNGDLFVSGSAPIKRETLETFYKVGVKVYEAYGQSELSTTIMNSPKNFRIGSVGKPSKKRVKLSEQGELLVKYNAEMDDDNKHVLTVNEGFVKTGDTAVFDKDGFLFITGRVDDVIVLSKGKKVFPKTIEDKFSFSSEIQKVCVYSKDQHRISAIIFSEVVDESKTLSIIQKINTSLVEHEKISDFVLVNDIPSVDNDLLTGTMKLKRKAIISRFSSSKSIPVQ